MTVKTDNTEKKDKTVVDELTMLKQQADLLGINYRSNSTAKSIRKSIMEALASEDDDKAETNEKLTQLKNENLKLKKVIVSPMASHMKDHQGQIFTVGNSMLGMHSKYVPFNVEWYVPEIILKHIKAQDMQIFVTKKLENGFETKQSKIIKAFGVQELPMPTKKELDELAQNQQARKAIDK